MLYDLCWCARVSHLVLDPAPGRHCYSSRLMKSHQPTTPLQSRYEGNDPHAPVIHVKLQTFRPPKSMRQIFPVTQDEGSSPTPVDGTSPIHQPVKYAELLHTSPPTRPYRSFFAMPTGFSFSLTLLFLRN